MNLYDLNVYKLSRELSKCAWSVYTTFDYNTKHIMGDQFIRSIDSITANIAEGFGRFHFLDRRKFYYNARGSLLEAITWLDLLYERNLVDKDFYDKINLLLTDLQIRLNNFIQQTTNQNNQC